MGIRFNNQKLPGKFGMTVPASGVRKLHELRQGEKYVVTAGVIVNKQTHLSKDGNWHICTLYLTNYIASLATVYITKDADEAQALMNEFHLQDSVRIYGNVDLYQGQLQLQLSGIQQVVGLEYVDSAAVKRVELKIFSKLSPLASIVDIKLLVKQAKQFGHEAVALTDLHSVQALPEFFKEARRAGIKPIAGATLSVLNPLPVVYAPQPRSCKLHEDCYVIFDLETTGLSSERHDIIQIGAVKVIRGEMVDSFSTYVRAKHAIPETIQALTAITENDLRDAPLLFDALLAFEAFIGDAILVAHNANFDLRFLHAKRQSLAMSPLANPVIDTLGLAKFLYPEFSAYNLKALADQLDVPLENHHQAQSDALATAGIFRKMLQALPLNMELSELHRQTENQVYGYPFPVTLYAINPKGIRHLYRLLSLAHTDFLTKAAPQLPKAVIIEYREGLLVSSPGFSGEVMTALMEHGEEAALQAIANYDFITVEPLPYAQPFIDSGLLHNEDEAKTFTSRLNELCNQTNKLLVAVGGVRHLNKHDHGLYSRFIQLRPYLSKNRPVFMPKAAPFLSTDELLDSLHYLPDAHCIVIDNALKVAAQVEEFELLPDEMPLPDLPGAAETVRAIAYESAQQRYGASLPDFISKRLETEIQAIISCGYAVIYEAARQIVAEAKAKGHFVGSRGSVGSSLVAYLLGITEVNPLPPHYVCLNCHDVERSELCSSGSDLPEIRCRCGAEMHRDGQQIPFETFLGLSGEKMPDIDLNFSQEYQEQAHNHLRAIFGGNDSVIRIGTISTTKEQSIYNAMSKANTSLNPAETAHLLQGLTGIKTTTGQHPGGLVIIPAHCQMEAFSPVHHPSNKKTAPVVTHFSKENLAHGLFKLDLLGQTEPFKLKKLYELTGVHPDSIPLSDAQVLQAFAQGRTLGIGEFNTELSRQMLMKIQPRTFGELVQISGLAHGTGVWEGNAKELFEHGFPLEQLISCRDDIMLTLENRGMERSVAFEVMETVRKGKKLQPELISEMRQTGLPSWYIAACRKINYLFPKAHAAAYAINAVKTMWYKLNTPLAFYAVCLTLDRDDFLLTNAFMPLNELGEKLNRQWKRVKSYRASVKERKQYKVNRMIHEARQSGIEFDRVRLYNSASTDFTIQSGKLVPPFAVLDGVGEAKVAVMLQERNQPFKNMTDLRTRGKAGKKLLEGLTKFGDLNDLF
jgi:DNA polymerase-3 subunit alpha (Gram-positive type)